MDRGVHAQESFRPVKNNYGGVGIIDLASTNGTFINKVRIREAYLKPGCTIGVGQSQLRWSAREEEVPVVPSRADRLGGLIGANPRMREIYTILERMEKISTAYAISAANYLEKNNDVRGSNTENVNVR